MKAFSLLTTLALAVLAATSADAASSTVDERPGVVRAAGARAGNTTQAAKSPAPAPAPAAGGGGGGSGPSPGCGKAGIKSGTFKTTINGKERQYMVRVPEGYDSKKPYKLVLLFHWRSGTMEDSVKNAGGWYGLAAQAKESAILVAPDGLGRGWANENGEDIKFVDAIVKAMDDGLCVNPKQRFATGFSYGAGMSHAVACARPDTFRAVSLISGGLISRCDGGNKPVAYQIMIGNNDQVLTPKQSKEIASVFIKANGCTPQDAPLPAIGAGKHIKTVYKGCKAGYPVIVNGFDGGHVAEPADKGGQNFAPAETWSFFSQFS
jgi:poly(3-hydroxybutyrate) depolymerase